MIEQLVNLVQNDRRRLPFLQKRIDMIPRTLGNMWHAGEHQNANIRLDPLHRRHNIIPVTLGHEVIEQN